MHPSPLPLSHPLLSSFSSSSLRHGRFCYFCASLPSPIRAQHTYVECPKRRKACAREYTAEAMDGIDEELRQRREACEAVIADNAVATKDASLEKKRLLEYGGALRVLSQQETHRLHAPGPPPLPPRSERRVQWQTMTRRRGHAARHVVKLVSLVERHEPTSWGQLKAVALMQPDLSRFPITPGWVRAVAASLEVDLAAKESAALLPTVIAVARAPLPIFWRRLDEKSAAPPPPPPQWRKDRARADGDAKPRWELSQLKRDESVLLDRKAMQAGIAAGYVEAAVARAGAGSSASDAEKNKSHVVCDCEHVVTGERRRGHPFAHALLPTLEGLRNRATRRSHYAPCDGWVQFAREVEGATDGRLRTYFHNFTTGEETTTDDFPAELMRAPCPLPPRVPEPSAAAIAKVGRTRWASELSGEALLRAARQHLWAPAQARRARQLAHTPCPVDETLVLAMYLGIDPQLYPELLWLADAAMTPDMPVGWLRCCDAADGISEYYWNATLGVAQWEHPQLSYISGVATRLVQSIARARGRAERSLPSRARAMSDVDEAPERELLEMAREE